jgi:glycosyltransferase involved in cell wall biosynthesis
MQFSIVIPTRNRAAKLRHALRSALAQAFDDFEVVVSNNQSDDDTEQVVLSQSHRKLRYVKAPRSMSMVDHWEFALGQARGDWVLFVCDDDALMPSALTCLADIAQAYPPIELIQYGVINYVYDDGTAVKGNYVDVPKQIPRSVRLIDSRRCLRKNFRRLSGDMPKFLNAAVNARLIRRLKETYGRIFWDWAPDYSSASLMLAHTQQFALSCPLMLWGENMESYGAGSARNPAHMLSFFKQFETFTGELRFSPYPDLLTVQNCVFDTYCRVRELLGREFAGLQIDPVRFRQILIKDCRRFVANGHPSYEAQVRKLEHDLACLRRKRLARPGRAIRDLLDGAGDVGQRMVRSFSRRWTGSHRRERHHFTNICDAAAFVGERACPVADAASRRIHDVVPQSASSTAA